MATLDTDEYLVVNPWRVRKHRRPPPEQERRTSWKLLGPGSVLKWLVDYLQKQQQTQTQGNKDTTNNCIQVPRLLFGSVENNHNNGTTKDVTHGLVHGNGTTKPPKLKLIDRSISPMETLRWKYHAAWNDTRNFQQKVVLDLYRIPNDDELWKDHFNSVHRPSRKYCAPETPDNNGGSLIVGNNVTVPASPLTAFHYIGSMERYFARPNDLRRNEKRYRQRSNLTFAREVGWIDQWLEQFVQSVGIQTASILLKDYIVEIDNDDDSKESKSDDEDDDDKEDSDDDSDDKSDKDDDSDEDDDSNDKGQAQLEEK